MTAVLSRFDVTVLDIGQAVIHDQLNLGILAAVPKSDDSEAMIADIQSNLLELDMQAQFCQSPMIAIKNGSSSRASHGI